MFTGFLTLRLDLFEFYIQERKNLKQVTILAKRSMAAQMRWQRDIEAKMTETNQSSSLAEPLIPAPAKGDEQTALIWRLGIELLAPQHPAPKARQLIGKWIKDYGEETVASALSELSIKASTVADRFTYITAILAKNAKKSTQRKATPGGAIVL